MASTGAKEVSLCVRLSDTNWSKALNLHLFLIGLSQVSLRSVSGQSKVSLRSVSGQSQALRSVFGSLRFLSGLSVLTSSDRRSLILRLVSLISTYLLIYLEHKKIY